jgi:glutamate synthase domain-containing protein 1
LYDPRFEHDACGVGFVVDIKGRKSHAIVSQAMEVLKNLLHRGACGCEVNTGDGAGILIQMPHAFLVRECARLGITLPAPRHYGSGLVFLPRDPAQAARCRAMLESMVTEEGQTLLGWRPVPTDDSPIGPSARAVEPVIEQVFIGRAAGISDAQAFERKLSKNRADKVFKRFERWGFFAVAVPALLPPPFPIVPFLLAAGAMQYSRKKFLGALVLGRGVRYSIAAYLGALYADAHPDRVRAMVAYARDLCPDASRKNSER